MKKIYTVGHSNHEIDKFCDIIKKNNITAIADVRSSPYSRFSQFNTDSLKASLKKHNIAYVFLGKELGARPQDPSLYTNDSVVDFKLVAESKAFKDGLGRVIEGSKKFNIAIMCSESNPEECHRTILITPQLEFKGFEVHHILKDGTENENKLYLQHKFTSDDMFNSVQELQENKIAYKVG